MVITWAKTILSVLVIFMDEFKPKNLILIGMMGSGKSSIGMKLAQDLEIDFIDTDQLIETQYDLIINLINEKGEEFFRNIESQVLQDLNQEKFSQNKIIATGGGIILREQNRKILKELGLIIWLKVKPETILSRLKKQENENRPLLKSNSEDEKLSKIINILKVRENLYADLADLVIDTDKIKNLAEISEKIINYFKNGNFTQ